MDRTGLRDGTVPHRIPSGVGAKEGTQSNRELISELRWVGANKQRSGTCDDLEFVMSRA